RTVRARECFVSAPRGEICGEQDLAVGRFDHAHRKEVHRLTFELLRRLNEVDSKRDTDPHHALNRTAVDDRLKLGHALNAALPDKSTKSQVLVVAGHEHFSDKPERSMRLLRRFFIAWVVALVRVDADTEPVAVDVVDPGAALKIGF